MQLRNASAGGGEGVAKDVVSGTQLQSLPKVLGQFSEVELRVGPLRTYVHRLNPQLILP